MVTSSCTLARRYHLCDAGTGRVLAFARLQKALGNLLLFNKLDKVTATRIVAEMFEMPVDAGEILIQQGDSGAAATKLFVVKSGKFEVRGACMHACKCGQRQCSVHEHAAQDARYRCMQQTRLHVAVTIIIPDACPRASLPRRGKCTCVAAHHAAQA